MSFNCQFGRETYPAGSFVSCILKSTPNINELAKFTSISKDLKVRVHAQGILHIDQKWTKASPELLSSLSQSSKFTDLVSIKKNSEVPLCFFITNKEAFNPQSFEEGKIVQFELPFSVPSTFKGLSATIIYSLVVSFLNQDLEPIYNLEFPFCVCSSGDSLQEKIAK